MDPTGSMMKEVALESKKKFTRLAQEAMNANGCNGSTVSGSNTSASIVEKVVDDDDDDVEDEKIRGDPGKNENVLEHPGNK